VGGRFSLHPPDQNLIRPLVRLLGLLLRALLPFLLLLLVAEEIRRDVSQAAVGLGTKTIIRLLPAARILFKSGAVQTAELVSSFLRW